MQLNKISFFIICILTLNLLGCKNPLDSRGTFVESLYSSFLSVPGEFDIVNYNSSSGQVTLTWTESTSASNYEVLYGVVSGIYTNSVSCNSPCLITGLTNNQIYYFKVKSTNLRGERVSESEVSVTPSSGQVLVPFVWSLPFDVGTEASYLLNANTELDSGVLRLKKIDQVDQGAGILDFGGGVASGTVFDSNLSYLRLDAVTNSSELDSSWTPHWDALKFYWKMNGAGPFSTTAVTKGNGSCSGSSSNVSYHSSSRVGNSLSVRSAAVNCAGTDVVSEGQEVSAMFWIKQEAGTGPAWREVVSSFAWSPTSVGWMIQREGTSNQVYIRVDTSAGTNQTCGRFTFLDGGWHHVTYVLGAGKIRFYFDGNLVSSCNLNIGSGFAANGPLYINGLNSDSRTHYDEIAIWNKILTDNEIKHIYNRQKTFTSGVFTSRVIDAMSVQNWNSIELSRTSLEFDLTQGLLGYWKLDDLSGASSVVDSSSSGYHGTIIGSEYRLEQTGVVGQSAYIKGLNTRISLPANAVLNNVQNNSYSMSIWFKPIKFASSLEGSIFTKPGWNIGLEINANGSFLMSHALASPSAFCWATSSTGYTLGSWYHLVGTVDKTLGLVKLYINGVESASCSFDPQRSSFGHGTGQFRIGGYGNGTSWESDGYFDEAMLWGRALSAAEVSQLHKRGALNTKIQVRNCADGSCSDQEALINSGKGWKDIDGSFYSYSEDRVGLKNESYSKSLNLGASRYVQYRAILESEDNRLTCNYGSGITSCSPQILSVSLGPNHYPSGYSIVTTQTTVGTLFQTLDVGGFVETLGANSCVGMRYTLSGDGNTFYYYNGSQWTPSTNTYATASSASTIAANLGSLPTSTGSGTLRVKIFMNSDGVTPCELDALRVEGQKY